MTTHYVDIKLKPDPEFSSPLLMGALFNKLHRALVDLVVNDIGISFPEYQLNPRSLGEQLRLHSDEARLKMLMESNWLSGMRDHIQLLEIQPVPSDAKHRVVCRRQYKTSVERLRRRRMKRKGESYDQAASTIPQYVERRPELPFVNLLSRSTGQRFSLFIEQREPRATPVGGIFNLYGLSAVATIPWF